MKRAASPLAVALLLAAAASTSGCGGSSSTATPGGGGNAAAGRGGSAGTGGASGAAGTAGAGGDATGGGAAGNGGSVAGSGGSGGTGAIAGSSGTAGTGGVAGNGGVAGRGGGSGAGGVAGRGGGSGAGGVGGTGGAAGAGGMYVPPASPRTDTLIDTGWKHLRMDSSGASATAFDDAAWASVTLPHTWNATDGQDGGSNYYRGIGWYRRHYTPPASAAGKRIFLQFDGANIVATVYVNGTMVGTHRGGFSRFRFDVTATMTPGSDNVIAVMVSNAAVSDVAPLSADFTFFGGLYRDVHVLMTDPVHVDALDFGASGVYVSASNVTATQRHAEHGRARAQRRDDHPAGRPRHRDRTRRRLDRGAPAGAGQPGGERVGVAGQQRGVPEPAPVERRRRPVPLHRVRRGPRERDRHRRRVGAARLSLLRRRRRAGVLAQRPVPGPARREQAPGSAEHGLGDHRRPARRGHGAHPRARRQRRAPVALRAVGALPRPGRPRRHRAVGRDSVGQRYHRLGGVHGQRPPADDRADSPELQPPVGAVLGHRQRAARRQHRDQQPADGAEHAGAPGGSLPAVDLRAVLHQRHRRAARAQRRRRLQHLLRLVRRVRQRRRSSAPGPTACTRRSRPGRSASANTAPAPASRSTQTIRPAPIRTARPTRRSGRTWCTSRTGSR